MSPSILAARAILFRFVRLLITITIESWVYKRELEISPKRGVEYALIINMFAEICGGFVFSFTQSLVTIDLARHLVIYLILDDFQKIAPDVLILTLFYFFIFLIAKWMGLLILNEFVFEKENRTQEPATDTSVLAMNQWGNQLKAVTKAHTISYFLTLLFSIFEIRVFNF
jgi:hypothetical protein